MKRWSMGMLGAAPLAALLALGGCKNGPNNARDTTGMTNTSAAGSIADTVGGATGAAGGSGVGATAAPGTPLDTALRTDTSKKKKKDSSYRKP